MKRLFAVAVAAAALVALSGPLTADAERCPSKITVKSIEAVKGEGYSWVRATYEGSEMKQAPAWTLSADVGAIMPYNDDIAVAYFGAPTGTYTVRATAPCGVYGEAEISHKAITR